jgi:hypothetical protein
MGIWSDWYERNAGKEQALTSAEFVLKKIDEAGAGETTLTDAGESSTLPATTKTLVTTLLQTIRNNLKWLFNNKANSSHTHTKSQITDFPTSMTPAAHNHDDRYYTESEADTRFQPKSLVFTHDNLISTLNAYGFVFKFSKTEVIPGYAGEKLIAFSIKLGENLWMYSWTDF